VESVAVDRVSIIQPLLTASLTLRPTDDRASRPAAPTVSVVVPTHGRPESLANCLAALAEQTLPRHAFEVIVCDDGSPEPVAPVVARFSDRLAVRVIRQPRKGPAAARNAAARHARGRYLAFTDDDCVPTPHWLELMLERMQRHPGHMIGGLIVNLLSRDPYATATQLIQSCVYDYYTRYDVGHRFFSTANLAMPASRFWMLDGFSERFSRAAGEDYDLCARWQEAGFPSEYAPEVEVGHAHGHTFGSFWRQHFGYGRALLRVRQGMARRRGRLGIQLESPGFYHQILTYPLRHSERRARNAALVALSQVATMAGALRELLFGAELPQGASDAARSPAGLSPGGAGVTATH
jgi:GT2 family glycosyltransferase